MNIKNQVALFSVCLVALLGLTIGWVCISTNDKIKEQHDELVIKQSVSVARSIAAQVAATRAT